MNFIMPLILIASSFAVFFGYVDPNYKGGTITSDTTIENYGVIPLRTELKKYQDISNSSTQIVTQRDALITKRNSISEVDQAKLERMLPSNIDNIRLIIEISKIATGRNLQAKNISVGDMTQKITSDSIGVNNIPYGTISLKFTVNASYANFLNFLQDLENNLRLLDITDITFNSTESGFYDFSVSLNTYWLK